MKFLMAFNLFQHVSRIALEHIFVLATGIHQLTLKHYNYVLCLGKRLYNTMNKLTLANGNTAEASSQTNRYHTHTQPTCLSILKDEFTEDELMLDSTPEAPPYKHNNHTASTTNNQV